MKNNIKNLTASLEALRQAEETIREQLKEEFVRVIDKVAKQKNASTNGIYMYLADTFNPTPIEDWAAIIRTWSKNTPPENGILMIKRRTVYGYREIPVDYDFIVALVKEFE